MMHGLLDFSEPVWLWALVVLVPIVYLWRTSRVPGSPLRRWVSLILRVALVVAVVFALAGARVVWHSDGICVIFVLDQSQSVPGATRDAARHAIEAQVQKMRKDDQFAVVEFGKDAVLGSLPSAKGGMPSSAQVSDTGHTDIARALRLAMASFPPDRQKRIVLFSDGNQNTGDALREARIAAAQDIDVDVILLAAQTQGNEVMVEQVIIPTQVRKDATFAIRAIISSDIPQPARLSVTRDGIHMPIGNDRVMLKAGTNVFDIPDSLSVGGYHHYAVTVDAEKDTFAANNTGYAFTRVDATGKVLVVRGKPDTEDYLSRALKSAGLEVQAVAGGQMPATARELASFDCVILDDVNAGVKNFSPTQMKELERWVTDFGGGLVLIGGDDSFGPGDYANTPLETVSPVSMEVKQKESMASVAIVIVNDKSGSMGAPAEGGVGKVKMDLANEGSIKVIEALDSRDYAMIGAVDTEVKWIGGARLLQMTDANKSALASDTRRVRAGGGGIYCSTALYGAYGLLTRSNVNAMTKHVIMFADACDAEQQPGCVSMAKQHYDRYGITTSCIGLGKESDPDVPFLKEVAGNPRRGETGLTNGRGRFYITDDSRELPRLFAKEAFIMNKKPYVEDVRGITMTRYHSPLLQGFESGMPKIYGYVGTTLKPRATLALHGLKSDEPVLAHWVIGLGKCVAYTSDASSRWGKDFIASPVYGKFWAQVVRWVSRTQESNVLATSTIIEGSSGTVVVEALDETGRPINNLAGMKAKILRPNIDARSEEVELEQVGPGRYQGKFAASERGTYLVTVFDGEQPLSTGGGVLSYPPEYRDLRANAPLLHAIAETSGGKYLASLDNIFESKPEPVRTLWPLWQALLIFLTIGLLLDVAWRRLNIADWFRQASFGGKPVLAGSGENLRAYQTIKAGRKEVQTQRETLRERVESLEKTTPAVSHPVILRAEKTEKPTATPQEKVEGYANRLMGAKKRAAEQIKEQSKPNDS
ncbi:MAG: VWA domain-containing protein [Phycisphaerales bacterium]|nr:VWA domain-containing protein [Phycisphaerales bacterium]